jgi:uncharacterized protein YbjT (DUF2867 family)
MTTFVVGGTGKTGRRVAQRLQARGVPVRIGSRSGEPPFDWEDRSTWAPALRGASAAYITYYPDLAVPGSTDAIAELAATALAGGTRRLVLLSGRGEEEAERAERALAASGAEWTVVRCSWFMQNFSEEFLLDQILAGEVALPAGHVRAPFVDAEDIADVAAAALTPLRAGVFRGVRVRSSTGGGAARVHRAPDLPAHRGPRRPQRSPDGRRLACLGPGAQGLQLLRRARHRRHRRLERCSLVTSGPLR